MSTYRSIYTGQEIDEATGKAHNHLNKELIDTYTQSDSDLTDAVQKKHTHSNKTILDNTTASYTEEEKNKLAGIETGAEVNAVDCVNGKTGAVTLTASDVGALPSATPIPAKTSDLQNDSGFITSYTETDPTVPSWAKQPTKPSYTASEVEAMPASAVVTAFWKGTQAEYDALTSKSDTTLYLITEESSSESSSGGFPEKEV